MYFAVLREHGVAHVFNSWTRMPPIGDQLDLPGSVSGPFLVARALLRPGRTYDEAVDAFAPYDRIQEPNPKLRRDLVRLVERAVQTRIPAYLLVNNRAEGSAPLTIAEVARLLPELAGVIERQGLVRFASSRSSPRWRRSDSRPAPTCSPARSRLLSDALESLVNLVAALAALVALWVAARPADKEHTYGHTKAEYFSSGFEGALILRRGGHHPGRGHAPAARAAGDRGSGARSRDHRRRRAAQPRCGPGAARGGTALRVRSRSRPTRSTSWRTCGPRWASSSAWPRRRSPAGTGSTRSSPSRWRCWSSGPGCDSCAARCSVCSTRHCRRNPWRAITAILERHGRDGVRYHALRTRQAGARRFISFHILVPGHWTVQRGHDLLEADRGAGPGRGAQQRGGHPPRADRGSGELGGHPARTALARDDYDVGGSRTSTPQVRSSPG